MISILDALAKAFRDLFQIKVMWVMIWPILLASLIWLVLAVIFWTTFSAWIAQGLDLIGIQAWLENLESTWIANGDTGYRPLPAVHSAGIGDCADPNLPLCHVHINPFSGRA